MVYIMPINGNGVEDGCTAQKRRVCVVDEKADGVRGIDAKTWGGAGVRRAKGFTGVDWKNKEKGEVKENT